MIADYSFKFDSPIVCTAIHNGHDLHLSTKNNLGISESDQLREEDPYTDFFTEICNNRIIGNFSRFEVDLNRSPKNAIYLKPEDAWGLNVRKEMVPGEEILRSMHMYHDFYRRTKLLFEEMEETFDKFFVYDIHSYNHRRSGPDGPIADLKGNPEINLGISNMPEHWYSLVEIIRNKLSQTQINGRPLDVRVNVKFPGGHFPRWIHNNFPDSAASIAVELKKIFMDEWTGRKNDEVTQILKNALASTIPDIINYLSSGE